MIAAAVALVLAASAVAALSRAHADTGGRNCPAEVEARETQVHADRSWTEHDLPGIGEYIEVHWQIHATGDPCIRVPGPTDWHYQGVVRLRPTDATALAHKYQDWRRVPTPASPSPDDYEWDTPSQMWPALAPFVPTGVRWMHSARYASSEFQGSRWGDLYLDPDRSLAFFVLYDH